MRVQQARGCDGRCAIRPGGSTTRHGGPSCSTSTPQPRGRVCRSSSTARSSQMSAAGPTTRAATRSAVVLKAMRRHMRDYTARCMPKIVHATTSVEQRQDGVAGRSAAAQIVIRRAAALDALDPMKGSGHQAPPASRGPGAGAGAETTAAVARVSLWLSLRIQATGRKRSRSGRSTWPAALAQPGAHLTGHR